MNCSKIETYPLITPCMFGNCVNNTCVCYENYSSFQEIFDLDGVYCSNNIYMSMVFNIINISLGLSVIYKKNKKSKHYCTSHNTNKRYHSCSCERNN